LADKTEFEAEQNAQFMRATMTDGLGKFAVVPDGYNLQSLEKYQERPNRIVTDHKFVSAKSFAEYLTRFATESMLITASSDKAQMYAVIDYHEGDRRVESCYDARHGSHKTTYTARQTDKIKAWLAVCGKPLGQIEFGLLLEERAVDVIQPEAAAIFEMVMQFEATKQVQFKSSTRLADGSRQFSYVEDNQTRGGMTLPDKIIIRAPIYQGMEPQDIKFLLRYRINEGSLKFIIEMHDKDEVLREAFERCVDAVQHDVKPDQTVYWVE
jgi:uncharacterized protein YfdQ (DUF2303 family)